MSISKMVEESLNMLPDTQRDITADSPIYIPPLLPERMIANNPAITQELAYSFDLAQIAIKHEFYDLANCLLYFALDKCDEMQKEKRSEITLSSKEVISSKILSKVKDLGGRASVRDVKQPLRKSAKSDEFDDILKTLV
jgi:hypothetical protein